MLELFYYYFFLKGGISIFNFKKITWLILFVIVLLGGILRFYNLSINPPGLYIDEVSIGVNAYDVLTTGKDQHGIAHPLFFSAFGEYKMPIYIYLVSGAMKIFGKNEFAIRFPSAFFGTLTIVSIFFLMKELYLSFDKKKKLVDIWGLLAAGILAISSWHLQFSRAGFEATVALFFYTSALVFFTLFIRKRNVAYIFLSILFLLITVYTYDGYRLIVPLTLIGGLLIGFKSNVNKQVLSWALGLFILLGLPLFFFTIGQGGLTRFSQTSAFTHHFPSLWQQLVADLIIFVKNYFSYFSLTYLFRFGDQINRHQIHDFGLLFIWQLPYIFVGIHTLTRFKQNLSTKIIFFLLLVSPIAAAMTIPSPHTLRFLSALIPFILLTVFGMSEIIKKRTLWAKGFIFFTIFFACIEFIFYCHYYWVHYPQEALVDWGGSCKEVALRVQRISGEYKHILVDPNVCIYEYFNFYTPTINVFPSTSIQKPLEWGNQKTLLIKAKNKYTPSGSLVNTIYLNNLNHDVFAQFWSI